MEVHDVFIVLGVSLTALALIVSAIGIRSESFPPSRPVMLLGIGLFVAVVGGTTTIAWLNGEEEIDHLRAEQEEGHVPTPAEVMEEYSAAASAATLEQSGEDKPGAPEEETATETAEVDGAALFDSEGCAGCHTLQAAGSSAEVGPNLDTELANEDPQFIEESIVAPDAVIAKGFGEGIMPDSFGETMTSEQIQALVTYLVDSTQK
jgi:mono/diheme cytochrome c family protein